MVNKDVNDISDNKKKDSPKPVVRKLKRIPSDVERKTVQENVPPKKKRIVIGELPDYDAIEKQNKEVPEKKKDEKPVKVTKEKEKKTADVERKKPEKPEEKKSVPKEKKKGFFSRVVDMMYEDENDEEISEPEEVSVQESPTDDGSFMVEEIKEDTDSTLAEISEVLSEINDEVPEVKPEPESKPEKSAEPEKKVPEQAKTSEKKPNNNNNSGSKKKKNKKKNNSGNKPSENKTVAKPEEKKPEVKPEEKKKESSGQDKKNQKTSSGTDKKPDSKDVKKNDEKKTTDNKKSEKQVADNKKKSVSVPEEKPKEKVSAPDVAKNGKQSILALICIILAIVGVIAIINTCISNMGGGKSANEKFAKAVYPAVITDISPFEDPNELTDNQILSTAIWSVIIDSEKLSQYPQRVDNVAIIPAEDIENIATEMFGDDMRELTHSTITTAESKFYYNEEADSYSVDIKPYTFTYSPEVKSVSKKDGKYIVEVDYIAEHPDWMEETVSKSAEYTLSKNNTNGYTIASMKIISDSPEN